MLTAVGGSGRLNMFDTMLCSLHFCALSGGFDMFGRVQYSTVATYHHVPS